MPKKVKKSLGRPHLHPEGETTPVHVRMPKKNKMAALRKFKGQTISEIVNRLIREAVT